MAGNSGEATLLLKIKQTGQEILDRFVITLGDVINIFSKLPAFIMDAVHAYRESELANNQLTQAMINQGVFAGELRTKYLEMAEALSKVTTFEKDQIIAAQASLQSLIGEKKITTELMTAVLDLSAAKKIDLATAANLVGKAISGSSDVLKRYGVHVKASTDESQKMGNVISAIEGRFKDFAKTEASNLGVLDQLKNSWKDFLKNTGSLFAPFVESVARGTKSVLDFFNSFAGPNVAQMNVQQLNSKIQQLAISIQKIKENSALDPFGMDAGEKSMMQALEKQIATLKNARDKIAEQEAAADEQSKANAQAKYEEKRATNLAQSEQDILDLAVAEKIEGDTELNARVEKDDAIIAQSTDQYARLAALRDKELIKKNVSDAAELKSDKQKNEEMKKNRGDFLSQMSSLQSSHNAAFATVGKAAAIAQIWINTGEAASSGSKWGMAMGGPPLAAAFSGLAWAAGAAQVAKVAGVQLAEGGIVKASPGGVQATIGEGGRDEAVIPLENGQIPGSGGSSTIIFNGPILGDESQAMEFARAIDRSLLKLRQSNQSVAFETDIF